VIALRRTDGSFEVTPNPDQRIEAGDVVIAIGTEPELRALEDVFELGAVAT
jgi:K+/H+ antiporter YhaU regulatory subunit KhtT